MAQGPWYFQSEGLHISNLVYRKMAFLLELSELLPHTMESCATYLSCLVFAS